jgi:hypothetical protein
MRSTAISLILYFAIAGAYAAYVGGDVKTFAEVSGGLIGARMFFAAIDGLGGLLEWHLYLKKAVAEMFLRVFRDQRFPPRYYSHDDFLNYLSRVQGDLGCTERVKWEAKAMESMLSMYENMGILVGTRHHAASEIALEAYSPKAQSPILQ